MSTRRARRRRVPPPARVTRVGMPSRWSHVERCGIHEARAYNRYSKLRSSPPPLFALESTRLRNYPAADPGTCPGIPLPRGRGRARPPFHPHVPGYPHCGFAAKVAAEKAARSHSSWIHLTQRSTQSHQTRSRLAPVSPVTPETLLSAARRPRVGRAAAAALLSAQASASWLWLCRRLGSGHSP